MGRVEPWRFEMESIDDEVRTASFCQKCCNPLKRVVGNLKFRRPFDPDATYPGTLFSFVYFNCKECPSVYMSPKQFKSDFLKEASASRELEFVLAPVEAPLIKVEMVDWLKE